MAIVDLRPLPVTTAPARRIPQLLGGLVLYGTSMAMQLRATLGLDPWDVFHQGLTALVNQWIPLSYGAVITIVSVFVLLLWIPLRQRPGIGTIANAAIIGFTTDATLAVLPEFSDLTVRIVVLALAIVGNALAGALYIGAGLGPGPRDGLMTGIVGRGIGSIRLVRTTIELTVLGIGWVLGGVVGVGTVVYALAIGPLLHLLLPRLEISSAVAADPDETVEPNGAPFSEPEGR